MRHLNVYTSKSSKVVDLTRKVRKGNISPENWDYILDNETEPLLSTCLKMVMSMIIGIKGNKCPGIFQ